MERLAFRNMPPSLPPVASLSEDESTFLSFLLPRLPKNDCLRFSFMTGSGLAEITVSVVVGGKMPVAEVVEVSASTMGMSSFTSAPASALISFFSSFFSYRRLVLISDTTK